MAAGVTKRLWEMTDLVEMLEAWEVSGKLNQEQNTQENTLGR
jgi:hypothetical protein